MVTTPEGRSIGEHDWHSSDYVDWWIHRDLGRDANRRQQLRAMLSHAAIAADPKLAVLAAASSIISSCFGRPGSLASSASGGKHRWRH